MNAAHTCPACGATYGSRHRQLNRPDPAAAPRAQLPDVAIDDATRAAMQAAVEQRPGPTG